MESDSVFPPVANDDFLIDPFLSDPLESSNIESDPFIMPKAENDIDLQCTICEKNPKFSDVSHLLTHISSKGHLAAKFKLEIQAKSDIAASQAFEQYNFWRHTNNIDHLLAERMSMKEQKQARKSRKSTSSKVTVKKEIKKENEQPSAQDTIASTPFANTPVNGFHAPIPRMIWPEAANDILLDEWEPRSMYETPTATREVPNFPRQKTPTLAPHVSRRSAGPTTPWKPNPEDDKDGNYGETTTKDKSTEKLTDSAKLKGVIWPGMDIFDSATPELKRMRNQKKDGTNLEQMLITSRDTEPYEYSYHANGEFRGSRDVFAPPSAEGSPVAPTPKKRKTRKTTTALSNKSTNAPRTRAPRGKKAAATQSPKKQAAPSKLAQPSSFYQHTHTLNPSAAGLGRIPFMPSVEEDEEFKLTMGAGGMGRKRRFDIYQDAVEASPARTETPLEEHRFDFQPLGMPPLPNELPGTSRFPVSPTPAAKPASYRVSGKENGQPEQQSQQHIRRTHSGPPSHIYPPHMLRDTSSINNPLYNHAYARSFGGFSQQTFSYNGMSSYQQANPMLGAFNPVNGFNPIARPQHHYGQGFGSNNTNDGQGLGSNNKNNGEDLGSKNDNDDFGMHYNP